MKSGDCKSGREELAERVSMVVKRSGLSASKFGHVIDVTNMSRKLNCVSPITDKDISMICSKFNVRKEWLESGDGEMGDVRRMGKSLSVDSVTTSDVNRVPYYDIDFTCSVREVYSDEAEAPAGFVSIPGSASADFCCRTSGDSMAPYIMRGDIVAMKKIENWSSFIPYNEVYGIVTTNGLRTIKVVRKGSKDGKIVLHSYNSDYEDQEIDAYTIVYMYKVMAIARVF